MNRKNIYLKIVVNLLITIFFAFMVIMFVPKLLSFFFPFVLAFILSLLCNPIIRFMETRIRIQRKHGSAILIIIVLVLLVGALYLLGVLLVRQIANMAKDIPQIAMQMTDILEQLKIRFSALYEFLPKGIQTLTDNFTDSIRSFLAGFFEGIELPDILAAGKYVKSVGDIFFQSMITVLATYFFIADREKMGKSLHKLLPESVVNGFSFVVQNFKNAVGGYFKAQFKIMLVLLAVMFITFLFLGIDYALLLALVIALIDLLPVFGTGLILWPWAIIDLVNQRFARAIVILCLYLVCQVIKQVLEPKLVGDSIGVSPFLTLVFMYIGYKLSGLSGMIIGVPVGMVFMNFYRLGMFDRILRGIKIIITDINEYRKY